MKLPTLACLIFLGLICPVAIAADDAALKQLVQSKAQEISNAIIKEDFGTAVDLTYPKLVELMGGREKMIAVMEAGTKEMNASGFAFGPSKFDPPSDPFKSGDALFVIVPFLQEMKVPDGRLLQKTFLIGVSNDAGRTWHFINGDVDLNRLKKVLPTLPEDLKLPEKQLPVFEKDK